ncbi:MAG: baseplate J/gp47 family protein [Sideroxydans sp.]
MFPTKDYRQIRADILRDIANQLPAAAVGDDSDFAMRANATASAIEGLYQHQQWIARQILPDTADSDFLERHAMLRGITRKPAAAATGAIQFTGLVGTVVPLATEAKTNGAITFVTTAEGIIGIGGTVSIAAQASVAGLSGNQPAATPLVLVGAPAGIQSNASIATMTGGVDIESDASLLARLLIDIRLPPAGGAPHDYDAWALEVPGVVDAYIFTQRRAANSIDVVIEAEGGAPSAQLILDVAAHIESVRPCCADVLVMAPTFVPVDITAVLALSGITLVDATTLINARLSSYFSALHVGDSVPRSKLITLMMEVSGVLDVNLTAPAVNIAILADSTHSQIAQIGVVTLT